MSTINDERTEMAGTMSFEPVSPFAKKLTLHYTEQTEDNRVIKGNLTFPYHPNEAIQTQIKQSINKRVEVDQGTFTFSTITATPLSTVVKGTWSFENLDRVHLPFERVDLIANGKPVPMEGSGVSTTEKGRTFELRYGALPKELESLQLVVREFPGYEKLDEKVNLTLASPADSISLAGKELWIKNVKMTGEGVEITLTTDGDVLLDGVSLETPEGIFKLSTTVGQTETKQEDGQILKTRTLLFKSNGQPEYLKIQGYHYMKAYDTVVEIPVD